MKKAAKKQKRNPKKDTTVSVEIVDHDKEHKTRIVERHVDSEIWRDKLRRTREVPVKLLMLEDIVDVRDSENDADYNNEKKSSQESSNASGNGLNNGGGRD
jgi:hypothetical protein